LREGRERERERRGKKRKKLKRCFERTEEFVGLV
jgi:hypothetical protein